VAHQLRQDDAWGTSTDATHSVLPVDGLPMPLVPRSGPAHLAVVVPVYNEARVLEFFAARLTASLEELDLSWSVLFVSDGSTDATVPLLDALAARNPAISYLCLSRNFGHQAALNAGLDHVDADVVLTMDGDLQHPPELIPTLLDAWRLGYDVVHTRKTSTEGLSLWRRLVTSLAYRAISRLGDVDIIPEASDFRLLDRTAVDALRALPERQPLYRGLTRWIGLRQAVIPFEAAQRQAGKSRYGLRQLTQLFARSFFDFSSGPLHVGIALGLVTTISCAGYVAFTAVAYVAGHGVPHGYVTVIFLIVLLGSINLTFSGILGVYLARVYNEVRQRPTYVVAHPHRAAAEAREKLEYVRPL
jgi:glycosyltransferase involved in cell wall biosynthesis